VNATGTNYQELLDRAKAGYPESWIPEKTGEHLAGTLTRVEMGNSNFGPAPIMVITDDKDKEWSIWCFHEALKSQIAQANPQTGDPMVILYLGKVKAKNPAPGRSSEYHAYRVVIERDEANAAIDWTSTFGTPQSTTEETVSDEDIPF